MNFYWLAVLLGASGTLAVSTLTENRSSFISITAQQVESVETCSDALVSDVMNALTTKGISFFFFVKF